MNKRSKISAGLALAATVTVVGAAPALANHWHSTNGIWHGFVHGSDAHDNNFHSRVEAGGGNPYKSCALQYLDSGYANDFASVGAGVNATCNVYSGGKWGEYASYALVKSEGNFNQHAHGGH